MARKALIIAFWAVMIVAPLAITAVAIISLPEGTELIPMQVGFDGKVNRWGAPSELWLVGGLLAGCNALMALCYRFNDALYGAGFVHGVSKKGALIAYDVCALVITGVTAWGLWFLLSKL